MQEVLSKNMADQIRKCRIKFDFSQTFCLGNFWLLFQGLDFDVTTSRECNLAICG